MYRTFFKIPHPTLQLYLRSSVQISIMSALSASFPWTKSPLIASAPMRLISGPSLAHSVSLAGGLGFLAAGVDVSTLSQNLAEYKTLLAKSPIANSTSSVLPIGVGFIVWGADLDLALKAFQESGNIPAAVWLFAPSTPSELKTWADGIRKVTSGKTQIWVQVSSVSAALDAVKFAAADVLVLQGADAGGHGTYASAGLISLVPEVIDTLAEYCDKTGVKRPEYIAAGGISDVRGVKAVLALGASGAGVGTRYLVAHEAVIAPGYRDAIIRAMDGATNTVRTDVYDQLRGTTGWPEGYGGRGVINKSYKDAISGIGMSENIKLYEESLKSGDKGWEGEAARLTTYAGTGVGLVKKAMSAVDITKELRGDISV